MVGPMVAIGMMTQTARLHGENEQDDQGRRSVPESSCYHHSQWSEEWQRLEAERWDKLRAEFREARQLASSSDALLDEAERTGFVITRRNEEVVRNYFFTVAYGLNDDYRINISSPRLVADYEIEAIINAFWFLVITEDKDEIDTADFREAIKVGGYIDVPLSLANASFHKSYWSYTHETYAFSNKLSVTLNRDF